MKEREHCRLKKWSVKKKKKRRKEEEIKTSKVCGGLSYVVTLLKKKLFFLFWGLGNHLENHFCMSTYKCTCLCYNLLNRDTWMVVMFVE